METKERRLHGPALLVSLVQYVHAGPPVVALPDADFVGSTQREFRMTWSNEAQLVCEHEISMFVSSLVFMAARR
jgi:hypothetical protein